jgi:putative peptidoglycan lipid II flippase
MRGLPWRSTVLVTAGALLGRLLGVGREGVFAHAYGASSVTDAYLVAVLIPTLVQNVVAGGTLQAAFVPLLAEEAARNGRAAAARLTADLNLLTLALLGIVTAAVALLAVPIVRLTALGFAPSTVALAAELLRWCSVLILMNGFLALVLGALNTFGEFGTTAALSPLLNTVQIAAIVVLAPTLGIYAAVVGLLAGTVAQCLAQTRPLRRHGIHLMRPRYAPGIWRRLMPAFVPAALASLVAQGNPLVDKAVGSFLDPGSITQLNYADLFAGSVAIVTTSVALVAFPTLAAALADGDHPRAFAVLQQSVHTNLLVAVPMAFLIGVFAPDLVRGVYGWGRVPASDLHQIALCVAAYAVGIPCTGLFYLLLRACYSVKRAGAALYLSLGYFLLHAAAAAALAPRLQAPGLALATSGTAVLTGLGGWFLLRNDLLRSAGRHALGLVGRLGIVAGVAAVLPWLLLSPWTAWRTTSPVGALVRLAIATASGGALFLGLLRWGSPESGQFVARGWRRLGARLTAG